MKKPIVGALSTALLLGMTASAFAVSVVEAPETTPVVAMGSVKVTLDGNVRMRGYMQQDTTDDESYDGAEGLPNSPDDTTGYDGRVQLGVKVNAGDGASGYIRLETGDTSSDVYGWGDNDAWASTSGLESDGGTKGADGNNDLSILEAWVQYQPCNVGIKVGHQLLSLGTKLFYDHTGSGDDAIKIFGETVWGANVEAGIIKFSEGQYSTDWLDGGAADHRDDFDGYYGSYTQKFTDVAVVDANLMYIHNDWDQMNFYNLGVDGSFNLGIVKLSADLEYQFGYMSDNVYADYKPQAKGYAAQVMASVDLKPFAVGAVVGYGSGDEYNEDDTEEDNLDNEGFINFLTDTTYLLVIPNYRVAIPGMDGIKNTGLSNLTVWQLFAKVDTTLPVYNKPLALEARVSKITLNEDVWTTNFDNGVSQDDLGVELAAFATLKITKNLAYKIEAAYLFAGDAWDYDNHTTEYVDEEEVRVNLSPDPDNAYFMRHTLELTF